MTATVSSDVIAQSGIRIPREEFELRWSNVQAAARALGLDGLVVASRGGASPDAYSDVFYLANFSSPFPLTRDVPRWWSGRSHSIVILPLDGEPTLVSDTTPAAGRSPVDDVRSAADMTQAAADAVRDRGLAGKRLGFVGDNAMLTGAYLSLVKHLKGTELVHVDGLVEKVRVIKSPLELRFMRNAAEVGNAAMDAMMKASLKPGTREDRCVAAAMKVIAESGGFFYDAACASGPTSFLYSHGSTLSWTSRELQAGDLFHVDFYGGVDGYFWDFARSCVVGGKATKDQLAILDTAVASVDAGLAAIKPGVPCKTIYEACRKVLVDADMAGEGFGGSPETTPGLTRDFPAHGHAYGLFWEAPWLLPDEETPLREHMCVAVEVMAGVPGVGAVKFEQDVIVTKDGCELLTTGPKFYL